MDNYTADYNSVKGVGCNVKNCKYNDKSANRCTAAHIDVQNHSALNKAETYCGTFVPHTKD